MADQILVLLVEDDDVDAELISRALGRMTANGGMNMGVITGLNADEDPTTRTPELDSEPHLCVPPLPAPNFAIPPAQLPTISGRNTFRLDRALRTCHPRG